MFQFSSVQFISVAHRVRLFVTPWTVASQASLSFTISWNLLKVISIEFMMPSNHLILCGPLLLPSIFSSIRVFSKSQLFTSDGQSIGALASILLMNIQGWFPLGWLFDLLAVQGTLKSLLQHHSAKASLLWRSAFFMVQFSHSYTTTGKTIALTIWTCGNKVMSLLLIHCLGLL